ncbi:MAG: hypothetical protein FVQ84_20265 [Planctomycetes bacterium]|nr:hypothetical protein [Planctomycetota bacterium]
MGKLKQIIITGIVLAGVGLFTMLSGCASDEAKFGSTLGTMGMKSPEATPQEAEAMVFAGMGDLSQSSQNSYNAENSISQIYFARNSNSSKLKVIYSPDGTALIPALTGSKINIHYIDGSVGTGTIKVKNGRSLFWEDQSEIDTIINLGIHFKIEHTLTKDNLHWFSINGTKLNNMVE